jgi:peroxisomal membrane protein 4
MAPDHSWMEEIHAIVAALAGGARYGFKIRVPHALVMTMLFRRDLPASEKIRSVVRLALEHATKLAAFATIYKVRTNTVVSNSVNRKKLGWKVS